MGTPILSARRSEQNKNWVLATKCPKVPTNFCSAEFYSAGPRNFYSTLTFLHLVLGVPVTQCPKIPTNFYSTDFCSTQFLFHIFILHFCSTFLFRIFSLHFCSASHPCVFDALLDFFVNFCNFRLNYITFAKQTDLIEA